MLNRKDSLTQVKGKSDVALSIEENKGTSYEGLKNGGNPGDTSEKSGLSYQ